MKSRTKKPAAVTSAEISSPAVICFRSVSILLCSILASLAFYQFFFRNAPLIWSWGPRLPLQEYTPWVQWAVQETDGMEPYILYLLSFAAVLTAAAGYQLSTWFFRTFNEAGLFLCILAAAALFYFSKLYYSKIGFHFPMAIAAAGTDRQIFLFIILCLSFLLSGLMKISPLLPAAIITLLLVPVCFISTHSMYPFDFTYLLSPALKILKGIGPQEIYAQYDYLLSGLLALWIRLGLSPFQFKLAAQFSYFALFLALYFFSGRLFQRRSLSIALLISAVIMRIYGALEDPVCSLQVSPLRLDLWVLPLFLCFYRGPSHLSVGITLGSLLIVHHGLGLIYIVSYLIFLTASFLLNAEFKNPFKDGYLALTAHKNNLLLIAAAFFIHRFFFGGQTAAALYQKYGVGFLPVSPQSFYWYVPVLFGLVFILLVQSKRSVPARYFETGILLLILAIGNFFYFYGRSHENNLLHLSSVLLFVLFYGLDLVDRILPPKLKALTPILSLILILSIVHYASGRGLARMGQQYTSFKEGDFLQEKGLPDLKTEEVRKAAGDEDRVLFLSLMDAYYYLQSGYTPKGYFHTHAWLLKKDMFHFLNEQLEKGVLLVIPKEETAQPFMQEILRGIPFTRKEDTGTFTILARDP